MIKNYYPLFAIISVFILGVWFSYKYFPAETETNILMAFVTFLVGTLIVYLYIRQKSDHKRDAANVIIAEIRQAERLIDQFKKSGVSNDIYYQLLPSNNWIKYSYLFINDLDQDEIEQINNFYSQCFVLDKAIDQINISHELRNKSQSIHNYLSLIAKESQGNETIFNENKNNFLKLMHKEGFTFKPDAPINSIVKALNNISFITTSTIGSKLKKMAEIK